MDKSNEKILEHAKAISEIIKQEHNPHTTVVIDDTHYRMMQDTEGCNFEDGLQWELSGVLTENEVKKIATPYGAGPDIFSDDTETTEE